jgi:hypothetical protein
MKRRTALIAGLALTMLLLFTACNDGQDDWSSSARITGQVYTDATHTRGVNCVQVILEADPNADNPYEGPDRWVTTNSDGFFEGAVFLGYKNGSYNYVADMKVSYFVGNRAFSWTGGITVAPGSVFTLPPVDTTMFSPLVAGQ